MYKCYPTFDVYDTHKLEEALRTLQSVYEYNYNSTQKVRLLGTIVRKLGKLIEEYGDKEV